MNCLRRNRGDAAGVKSGASPVDRTTVNVGTIRFRSPVPLTPGSGGSNRDRRDARQRRGWDGAVVVLRARESRVHGEERQRVSQGGKECPKMRR